MKENAQQTIPATKETTVQNETSSIKSIIQEKPVMAALPPTAVQAVKEQLNNIYSDYSLVHL